MKKLRIILIAVFVITILSNFPIAVWGEHDVNKIIYLRKTVIQTRGENVYVPEAMISKSVLYVSFDAYGMYTLYIEDGLGGTVYTSILPADGMEYSYDLTGIGEGLFRLVIDGSAGEYEGYFTL